MGMWQRGITGIDLNIKQPEIVTLIDRAMTRFIKDMYYPQGFGLSFKLLWCAGARLCCRPRAGSGQVHSNRNPQTFIHHQSPFFIVCQELFS